ncbi:MAG: DNA polymerase III subunit epsilon [Aestuariivita sp.]|nr:DNA polymerase III subunit epsilon [Aestuariivita sp.]
MREVVLDTETTGVNYAKGDRIVEIGALELQNHIPTGRTFHKYINPERAMSKGALSIHGLSDTFLKDKPKFADVSKEFMEFIADSKLVIHNAEFDIGFINAELALVNIAPISLSQAIDTLEIAKKKFPGTPKSLDALCRKFGIDNSARKLHGALLDSEILAEVYLELIGGKQPNLFIDSHQGMQKKRQDKPISVRLRKKSLPSRLTAAEKAAHEIFVLKLGDGALWLSK